MAASGFAHPHIETTAASPTNTPGEAAAPSPPLSPRTLHRQWLLGIFDAAADYNCCKRISSPRIPRYVHIPAKAMPPSHAAFFQHWAIYRIPLAALDPTVAYAWRSFEVFV